MGFQKSGASIFTYIVFIKVTILFPISNFFFGFTAFLEIKKKYYINIYFMYINFDGHELAVELERLKLWRVIRAKRDVKLKFLPKILTVH